VVQFCPPSLEANASPGDDVVPGADVAPTETQNVPTQDTPAPTSDEPFVQVAPPSDVTTGSAVPYVFVASLRTSPTHDSELAHEIVPSPAGPAATVPTDQLSPPSWLTELIEGDDAPGPGPAPPMMQSEALGQVTDISEARPPGESSSVQVVPSSDVRATADPTATQTLDEAHATPPTDPTWEGRAMEVQCCPESVVATANGVAGELPWGLDTPPTEMHCVTVGQATALNQPCAIGPVPARTRLHRCS
jgi:hypothetical protein